MPHHNVARLFTFVKCGGPCRDEPRCTVDGLDMRRPVSDSRSKRAKRGSLAAWKVRGAPRGVSPEGDRRYAREFGLSLAMVAAMKFPWTSVRWLLHPKAGQFRAS